VDPTDTTRLPEVVWRRDLLVAAALAVLVLAAFGQALSFGFLASDDEPIITENPHVQQGMCLSSAQWAATGFNFGIWMPLTNLTHMFDACFWGANAKGHHLSSLIWHTAATITWYFALLLLTGRPFESALATLLFAVHPMRTGAVVWVASRKELTCGFFYALAVLLHARQAARPSVGRWLAVAGAMTLGVLSKPMIVTLPCALLLLDWWPLRRFDAAAGDIRPLWRRALPPVAEKLPLLVLVVFSSWMAYIGQRKLGNIAWNEDMSLCYNVQNAMVSYVRYLWHTVFPVHLVWHYPVLYKSLTPVWAAGAGAVLAVITLAAAALRRQRYTLVAWLWFLGTLVPVIGIVGFATESMADRYTYIPHMGLFVAVAWGWTALGRKLDRRFPRKFRTAKKMQGKMSVAARASAASSAPGRLTRAGAALLITASMVLCVWQSWYWGDSERMFQRALAVMHGANGMAHAGLAQLRQKQNQPDQAAFHCREALKLEPDNPFFLSNMGGLLLARKEHQEAEKLLAAPAHRHTDFGALQMYYGLALYGQRRYDEAKTYLARAAGAPDAEPLMHFNYALCLVALGEHETARRELEYVRSHSKDFEADGVLDFIRRKEAAGITGPEPQAVPGPPR